jgi:hypothetical protein
LALALLAGCGNTAPTASPSPAPSAAPQATAMTALASPTAPPATPTRATPATPSGTPSTGTPGAATPGANVSYPEIVRRSIAQLATDKNIPESQIELVSVEQVEWPDSSLGCPEPGRAYLTVITPGYRIILKANNTQHEYHTNEKNMVIRCPK